MDDAGDRVLTLVTREIGSPMRTFDWIDRQIILPPVPPDLASRPDRSELMTPARLVFAAGAIASDWSCGRGCAAAGGKSPNTGL